MGNRLKILFLCTGNSCRSQMAEGLVRHLKHDEIEAYSAGTEPKGLNPLAVEAMQELGIDISGHKSKHVKELGNISFDYVLTLCGSAHESCPVFRGSKVMHFGFEDPPKLAEKAASKEAKLVFYRQVRDQLRDFVSQLPQILTGEESKKEHDAATSQPSLEADYLPGLEQSFVVGAVDTAVGKVPQVSSTLGWRDYAGMLQVRFDIGRTSYTVDPGVYALGTPQATSPVVVSANYKFSFDLLRAALGGRNTWILVLDTNGINVWCAAGKGTFGTRELVDRLAASRIAELVSHRDLILPQLGAPGVAAHEVKKLSGFRVRYGPIRASDLPSYLDAGCQATPEMRRKTFTLSERAVLIPVELVQACKVALFLVPVLLLLGGIGPTAQFWQNAGNYGLWAGIALLTTIVAGTCLLPILLPVLPGRAFSAKGLILGLGVALLLIWLRQGTLWWPCDVWEAVAWLCAVPALTSYLAMNFTGCSTYTSLSGVKKEMRWAVPVQIVGVALGLLIWLVARLM